MASMVEIINIYDEIVIPLFVLSSDQEPGRLDDIEDSFGSLTEFDVKIVNTGRHQAREVWRSIVEIINAAIEENDDVIILCEDNHEFTEFYSKEFLIRNIIEASEQGVAILAGGLSNFGYAVPLTENRFWVSTMVSPKFIILYKGIFEKIAKYKFKKTDLVENVLSEMTSHKMVLFPFISRQQKDDVVCEMAGKRFEKMQDAYLKYGLNLSK